MSAPARIEQATANSKLLVDAARLHAQCLTSTLTSLRGANTIAGLYRYLVTHGHNVSLAIRNEQIVGGIVTLREKKRHSAMFMLSYRPWSWLSVLRKLGLRNLTRQLQDLFALQQRARELPRHDYILALYVAESMRHSGIARRLLKIVQDDARARGVGLVVDTLLDNSAARRLYATSSFSEHGETDLSVILNWDAE